MFNKHPNAAKNLQLSVNNPPNSTWKLAWGHVDNLSNTTWKDDRIAIFGEFAISPNGRFVVSGEIWLSQRENLQTNGGAKSDLELVAIAWENWGIATWEKLVGVFCLAVWDRDRQELYLGRDRSGAKTLYYTTTGSTRWISGNMRSLATHRSNELDEIALRNYLCCAFVPGDRTMWAQIRELRPGTYLHLPEGKIAAYWQLQERVQESNLSIEVWGDRLLDLLECITQEYLPTDAPVGVFLSGGLDSSCIAALAAKLHSKTVHTYSIHFGRELANELEFSSLVAKHCQTEHHILEIPLAEMWQRLPETMSVLDDPIGDPLTVPNLLLGRLASQDVNIILNGEGGDPCFGGPKNQPMLIHSLYHPVTQTNPIAAYLQSFQKCAPDLPQLLQPEIWARVKSVPYIFESELNSTANYLNRLMALNIKFKGADQIMTKVNNLTQAAGMSGRSPLFDGRVIDFSMAVPPIYKLNGTTEKAVLKQAAIDLLPPQIIHRPKSGMMVPVQLGFRDYWNRQARSLLLNKNAKISPYLNKLPIENWLGYQGDPWGRYGVKLWLLASLEYWLQANDSNAK